VDYDKIESMINSKVTVCLENEF
jgi:hypothetical protein